MTVKAWQVAPEDNVAVVIADVAKGDTVTWGSGSVVALSDIPQGHKIALEEIAENSMVKKYAVPIGRASKTIEAGEHVHTQNLEDITGQLCAAYYKTYMEKGQN
jgi:predicted RecA/RadA family phage recombinase